jgi:type IV pilus assembly protein PilW
MFTFCYKRNKGFTLVEVLIALAISGLLMTAVYTAFQSQQRSYLAQDQVAEMQQNIRVGLDIMVREIRMAGFDPVGSADAGITTATVGRFSFTQDINADNDGIDNDGDGSTDENDGSENFPNGSLGDSNETVTYGFSNSDDSEPDGVVDGGGVASLGRDTGGGFQPVAENIQAIEFNYLDEDGNVTVALDDIRSVQISILARAQRPDRNYSDTRAYPDNGTTPGGVTWGPFDDNFRRRFQTITVKLRNMGI